MDAVGISILSGAHLTLFPAIVDELKTQDYHLIILDLQLPVPAGAEGGLNGQYNGRRRRH